MYMKGSYHQERIIREEAREVMGTEGTGAYNIPIILQMNCLPKVEDIRTALNILYKKHEILRTKLRIEDDEVVQDIENKAEPILGVLDLTNQLISYEELIALLKENNRKPFEEVIGKELIRNLFVKTKAQGSFLLMTLHHSICDEVSKEILKRDFIESYMDAERKEKTYFEEDLLQYADYSEWQNEQDDEILETQFMYWKRKLNKELQPLELPSDRERSGRTDYEAGELILELGEEFTKKAETFQENWKVSGNTLFLSAFKVLLMKYTGVTGINVGTSIRQRVDENMNNTVGPISNLAVLSDELNQEDTFSEVMNGVGQTYKEAEKYNRIPYEKLAEEIGNGKGNVLFQVMFNYEEKNGDISGFREIATNLGWGKYDYNVLVQKKEGVHKLYITYNKQYFDEVTAKRLGNSYIFLCNNLMDNPAQRISDAISITNEDKVLLTETWTGTVAKHLTDYCVHEIFTKLAEKQPSRIAVRDESKSVTYGELDQSSNQIAAWLSNHGVKHHDIVAMVMDRDVRTIELMMGILKAGACYLTIEPNLPKERAQYILEDSNPSLVIIEGKYGAEFAEANRAANLENLFKEKDKFDTHYNSEAEQNDAAYIIYTSGTTGNPKGVVVEHKNLARLVTHSRDLFGFVPEDVWSMFHSYSFDFSVWEIYGALLTGGQVAIVPRSVAKDTREFRNFLNKYGVTVLSQTPTAFNALSAYEQDLTENNLKVKHIIFGGEALKSGNLATFRERYKDVNFINMYGITETTIHVTFKEVTDEEIENGINSIGVPLPNYQVYILDSQQQIVPVGVTGEIVVGGTGVARGYWNREELTAQKFIANPHGEGRLYRSGDLGRWTANGTLQYCGRMDEQIKIRGFRIELGEIENAMKQKAGIRDGAVIAREMHGDTAICAYFVSDTEVSIAGLKEQLGKRLPEYMIPSYFMQIDSIPLTTNGKLDKKQLPEIKANILNQYVEAENEVQRNIIEVFQEILGLEQIGIKDNFFEIGGHSLRATRAINGIEEKTGIRISLKDFFTNPTAEGLSNLVTEGNNYYKAIPKADKKPVYTMTSAQKRLYAVNELDQDGTAYNMTHGTEVIGKLDFVKVIDVFEKLIHRHEVLRTGFCMNECEAVQKVEDKVTFEVEFDEVENITEEESEKMLEDFTRPYCLKTAPLFRAKAVKVQNGNDLLFMDIHHIIADGMSVSLLAEEFVKLYAGEELEELEVQYKDYSEWMETRDLSDQRDYWLNEFEDGVCVPELPLDYSRPTAQSFRGSSVEELIPADIKKKIMELGRETGTTEYMILLSAFMVLVSKYSRQEDIAIGTPISGRTHKDTEKMLGMFVNTLVMRGMPTSSKTFKEFLYEIKEKCLKAQENQEYPFEELAKAIVPNRDSSRNPMFDIMFALQNNEDMELKADGVVFREIKAEQNISKFDLTVNISENKEQYGLAFEYCTDLFKEESIVNMMKHYIDLLEKVVLNPEQTMEKIELSTDEEKEQIIHEFNNTYTEIPKDKTIVELFEEQVAKTPDKIAIVYGEQSITYRELNSKANSISYRLRRLGVEPEDRVLLLAEKSIEILIGICGIVKAGGTYVPIDPSYPKDRIEYIIEDSAPKAVIVNGTEIDTKVPVIDVENIRDNKEIWDNFETVNTPKDMLYIIYTSGTTGRPKGVMIEHQCVVSLIRNSNYITLDEHSSILQTGALGFDASTFEIWGALLNGGCVHLADSDVLLDARVLKEKISKDSVNTMFITTALFNQLINEDSHVFDGLETLLFGGEKTSEHHVKKLLDTNKTVRLANVYGPTETTTFATWYPIENSSGTDKIPIGKPLSNKNTYIMNGSKLCGIGVPGELCIAGEGVARGYLGNDDLTSEKFIDNPYGEGKMYRSGDLVRWLPDGNIEFLGRIDQQVKIRGFRIEPGEIENVIRGIEGIQDVAVIVKDDKEDKYLCAYLVSEKMIEINELRNNLGELLPEYMVPAHMMQIDKIPVNRNGKLDKARLPEIEAAANDDYVAPRNAMEEDVITVLEDVLGVGRIGIKDNFYQLGGDSIKAIRAVSKLREMNYELTIKDIMQSRILEQVFPKIKVNEKGNCYEQGTVEGEVHLTPIQTRFFGWNMKNPDHFNQSVMLKLKKPFNAEALNNTLKAVVLHHDILRSVYKDGSLNILSEKESKLYELEKHDFSTLDDITFQQKMYQINTELQASMNLEEGPLMKAGWYQTEKGDYLMLCIHHLVVDGVSWRIVIEDFMTVYEQYCTEQPIKLPGKTASYMDWSKALMEYAESEELKSEQKYWEKICSELSDGRITPDANGGESGYGTSILKLDEGKTGDLLYHSNKAYNTEINDIFLTALGMALKSWKGNSSFAVDLEGHGREKLHKDIDVNRTVGWFTSIYPVVVTVPDNMEEAITRTKEMLRHVPNRGVGYSVMRYLGKYDFPDHEADISFNYMGQWDNEAKKTDGMTASDLSCGMESDPENRQTNSITVNGGIQHGKLVLTIRYDRSRYTEASVGDFTELFKESLTDLINFCTGKKENTKTAYDYNECLTDDVLKEILCAI